MKIGNLPKQGTIAKEGKIYWKLSVGRGAIQTMYFDGGWHGFEFIVFKRYKKQDEDIGHPYVFRIAFAYWLPIYFF